MTGQDWITQLDLSPHPEGGHYKEVYRNVEKMDAPQPFNNTFIVYATIVQSKINVPK